ncbi:MAG: hypothetical protein BGO14_00930 [Chlamydiales bacterium 38-26]|nr:hypothetical protein [Chlamydiales bacterium]OJV07285.1 MAG: hypothetical protein BGO14_00930 [Chlamydiales bacterium 38-26]
MDDTKLREILTVLHKIKNKEDPSDLIRKFQNEIWNREETDEILSELASDLDDYEPNPLLRMEDRSYYGNEKLVQVINNFLGRMNLNNMDK